jgi:hypothetical protein
MQQPSNCRINFLIVICFTLLFSSSCRKNDNNNPGNSKVFTTLDRTLLPVDVTLNPAVTIYDAAKFDQYGYGQFTYGPGVPCEKRPDLMQTGYAAETVTPSATLLHFFTVTDIHLTDKESPCQVIYFDSMAGPGGIGCFSPLILYTTHVFNAAVQTINKLDDERAFDLGLTLGDMETIPRKTKWAGFLN